MCRTCFASAGAATHSHWPRILTAEVISERNCLQKAGDTGGGSVSGSWLGKGEFLNQHKVLQLHTFGWGRGKLVFIFEGKVLSSQWNDKNCLSVQK